jgi:hypothetical protein
MLLPGPTSHHSRAKGRNGGRQVRHALDVLGSRGRLQKISTPFQPLKSRQRPVQDPGQFFRQLGRQFAIFLAVERFRQPQNDESSSDGSRSVRENRQYVGRYQEPNVEPARPERSIFSVDGLGVAPRD